MIDKREVAWGLVGTLSFIVLIIAAWQLSGTTGASWGDILVMVMIGGVAGGIPYLPPRIMSKYRALWLLLGLVAWGILIFWRGERSLRFLGISLAWLIAAIGHFAQKRRSRTASRGTEEMSTDSQSAER